MERDRENHLEEAARAISGATFLTAFTGAGISVESGIPPFRGESGIWNSYDPEILDIDFFRNSPEKSWPVIKEIFYQFFGKAQPNAAHLFLAALERTGKLQTIITQNIDDLHTRAGSKNVIEFHGNSRRLICLNCRTTVDATPHVLQEPVPTCSCGGVYKPDFVFFGERIPEAALTASDSAVRKTDVMIVIGSTGEVYPAASYPEEAKRRGAVIIEINPHESNFTRTITDIFLPMKSVEASVALAHLLKIPLDASKN